MADHGLGEFLNAANVFVIRDSYSAFVLRMLWWQPMNDWARIGPERRKDWAKQG